MAQWCTVIVFAACIGVTTPLLAVDYPSWQLSPDSKLTLNPDQAALTTRSFDFTFPSGWKIDVSDVGFVYASVAKDSTPMIAISSCSMFRSREDCVATTRDVRARILTSPWKGQTSPPTKAQRSDNVEEYTQFGTAVLSRVPVRTIMKTFFSSSDYVIVAYYSPVASESEIESELAVLLASNLHLRMNGP